eukprot:1813048-Pleurochrysis_carterae.AAC.1
MSAAAASVSMRPQRPRPSVVPANVPARVSAASGLCPPRSLTTGASSRSTVRTETTNWSTSSCTVG